MKFFCIILFLSTLTGCQSAFILIPKGDYTSNKTNEIITINGKKIKFILFLIDNKSILKKYEKECNYNITEDGRIIPYTIASTEYFLGIGKYEWFWVDGQIVKRDLKKGTDLEYYQLR
jgi:hypothetical protein